MSGFTEAIRKTLAGSLRALRDYPAAILSAALFALVTLVRIQIDFPQQGSFAFLFSCLSWSLALGTIFSLMAITFFHSRFNTKKSFLLANILSLSAVIFSFLILFLFSEAETALPEYSYQGYDLLSPLAVGRISVVMLVSYLLFIVFSGQPAKAELSAYQPEDASNVTSAKPVKIIAGEGESAQADAISAEPEEAVGRKLPQPDGVDAAKSAGPDESAEIKSKSAAAKKDSGIFGIDFAGALFMHIKAFSVAFIYGMVMLIGASGVAGAIQALLYQDMSFKVYQYISTITGFIAFTIFVGYFPDFRKGAKDEPREKAKEQPRFVEILFEYIMIPLMIALTAVLLIWTGRTVIFGLDVSFVELAGIAAVFSLAGLWLHMMVSKYKSKMAKFYLRFYPLAALLILVPYAMALWKQLDKTGLKLTEYWFMLIWLAAAAGAILLLFRQVGAYTRIVAIACVLAVFSVLPFVGYNVLPVKAQSARLEALLTAEDMLAEDTIIPAKEEPRLEVRAAITDASDYLANANDAKLPVWFEKYMKTGRDFENVFGFAQVWIMDEDAAPGSSTGLSLYLPDKPIKIDEYSLAIPVRPSYDREQYYITAEGEEGSYRIYWPDFGTTIPELKIWLGEELILQQDMSDYIDGLLAKYPLNDLVPASAGLEDMTMVLESAEIKILLVFRNVEIIMEPQPEAIYYSVNLETIYLKEK